jgi:hypothetical protein
VHNNNKKPDFIPIYNCIKPRHGLVHNNKNRFLFHAKKTGMDECTTATPKTKTGFHSRLKPQTWMSTQQTKPVYILL